MMRHGLFIALVASQIGWGGLAARGVEDTNTVYLFSTFREPEQDGLRFAYSFDGYHWSNVPGLFLKARVGGGILRDPSVCRGPDGTWHLVWTTAWRGDKGFGYAHSKDLVHWSEQRFIEGMAHEPETVNTWAPELFYDEASGRFFICWASTIPGRFADGRETPTNNHRMYFTTTADFQTFTPSRLFLDPGFSVIDCQILKAGPRYVLLLKDNTRPERNIKVAFGDAPSGPWREVSAGLTEHLTEGPSGLRIGEDWLIYYEAYQQKRYGVMKTRDFKTFEDVTSQAVFPPGLKHGTAFQATRKDLDYLFKVGTQQVWNVRLPWASPVPAERVRARLAEIESVARAGPFQPDWASITNAFRTPSWYRDAKFGIFILWGVYSVPAFGSEWYPRTCTPPARPSSSTTAPPTVRRTFSVTRISFPGSPPGRSTRARGRNCSRKRARAMLCPSRSITTGSRCTTARSRSGRRSNGARGGMCWRSRPGRIGGRGWCRAPPRTAPSTGSFSTRAFTGIRMCGTRTTPRCTGRRGTNGPPRRRRKSRMNPSFRIGCCGPARLWTNTGRSCSISIGGFASRCSSLT
jgi:hypothetical protein